MTAALIQPASGSADVPNPAIISALTYRLRQVDTLLAVDITANNVTIEFDPRELLPIPYNFTVLGALGNTFSWTNLRNAGVGAVVGPTAVQHAAVVYPFLGLAGGNVQAIHHARLDTRLCCLYRLGYLWFCRFRCFMARR